MLAQPSINHSFESLMETKDQSNQNPENVDQNQEANPLHVEETVEITTNETETADAEVLLPEAEVVAAAEIVSPEPVSLAEVSEPLTETEVDVNQPEVVTESEEPATQIQAEMAEETAVPSETTEVAEAEELAGNAEPIEAEAEPVADETETIAEVAEVKAEEETASVAEEHPEPTVAEVVPAIESVGEETILLAEDTVEDDEADEIEVHESESDASGLFDNLGREQLVEKLEELVQDPNVNTIKSAVGQIRLAFLKLNKEYKQELYQKLAETNVEAEAEADQEAEAPQIQEDAIEERFKSAFNIYKHNKGKYNEEQEKQKIRNLEAKNQILDELKVLINSEETLKKTYDEFKILQERWKTIGMVPKGDINTLWQNYHFLVEKFFDKVKINKELKDLDLKKNLEAKIHLCEKAEELLLEPSIIKSFKSLQQYHEEWKEIGPVPQDKKDELWDRFRSATEQINDRRREYYNEMQESLEQNLTAKVILCEKAEQLLAAESDSIKAWQDVTAQFTELLKIWKTIGPAPKKQNNEIWARFKTSLDGFFNAKKEFFNKLKEQQMNNFNLKLDLCVQAEALRNSTDWKNTSRELINLQNEWKKIGPVPRKQSDRIWKRFRAACDEFFSTKAEYFKNVSGQEEENLKLKLSLIEQVKEFSVGDDRNVAVDTLKDFQRQWMEIGHVPIKEKDRLQTEFRSLINKHFEKLKMESVSMGAMNYRSRVERMAKDSPDAGRVISKERSFVQGKIQQLQDEIKTWENNIGFFAKSKTANLLKQEFEKKIEKAKEELQMLEAKLKMLRETNQ